MCTKLEASSHSGDIEGSQNYENRSCDVSHASCDLVLLFWFLGLAVNVCTKFEASSHSGDIEGYQNYNSRSRCIGHVPCYLLLHFFGLQAWQ